MKPDRTKRTIEFHPDAVSLLESLRIKYSLKDECQVLQKAMQLLAVASERKIYVENDDGQIQEVVITDEKLNLRLVIDNDRSN